MELKLVKMLKGINNFEHNSWEENWLTMEFEDRISMFTKIHEESWQE